MRWLVLAVWLTAVTPARAGVAIAGLSGDASFTAAAPGEWSHTFVVYADAATPLGKDGVWVRITDFQTDSGHRAAPRRPIEVAWLGDDGDARRDAASFAIAVVLPEPGLYVATMVIGAPGQPPQVRQLSIQVGSAAPASALPVAQVGPRDVEATGAATLVLGFRNTGAAARTVAVAAPIVTHKRAGRALPADVAVRWSLMPGASGASGATTPTGAGPSDPAPAGTVRVPGGGDATMQVAISEAPPGEYAVEVQLSEPGMAPLTLSGAAFIRRSLAWAIAVIAAGVLLASAISRLRDVWLDTQSQRINLGRVVERLQVEPNGDAARDALRELQRQADDLARAIPERRDCKGDIENLGRRTVVFLRANSAASDISRLPELAELRGQPGLSAASEPHDDRRDELRKRLDEVFRLLTLPTGEAAATEKLSELESRDAERHELKAQLDALAVSISDHQLGADPALAARLIELADRMAHVRELYQRDELTAASRDVAEIRDALARAGRDAIQRASESTPAWTSDDSWNRAMAPVKKLLASPKATYDAVRIAFVDASVALTVQEVQHPDTARLAAAKDLPAKIRLLAAIHGDLSGEPQPRGLEAGVLGPLLGLRAPTIGAARSEPPPFEWRALARRSTRVELLLLGVVMAIAVVAGVKALWIDNATWGSSGDLIAAFLWGSGVQVGAEAFIGLSALRAALGRR